MSTNIDGRGMICPQPVIAVKKALESITDGVVTILVDNRIAKENVTKFAAAHGCCASVTQQAENFLIEIIKGEPVPVKAEDQPFVPTGNTVYVITQKTLGNGNEELGGVLMKSLFFTLLETQPAPKTVLFMNGGVLLTTQGSPILGHLQQLAEKGVEILSCGTCLDYYGLKDKLAVGGVTNMYTIVETMSFAGKVITL